MKLPIHCFKSTFSSMLFVLLAQCLFFFSISSFFFRFTMLFFFTFFFLNTVCLSQTIHFLFHFLPLCGFFPLVLDQQNTTGKMGEFK